jgi:serine protease AprX
MKIIAHFMHELEAQVARTEMTKFATTDSYLVGEIDPNKIPTLEKAGVIVERLEKETRAGALEAEEFEPKTKGLPPLGMQDMMAKGEMGEPTAPQEMEAPIDLTRPNFYLIQMSGPLLEQWRQSLTDLSVELLEFRPPDSYSCRLNPDQVKSLQQLPFVKLVRLYDAQDTFAQAPVTKGLVPSLVQRMQAYEVRLHRPEDLDKVRKWLEEKNVAIAGAKGRKVRLYLLENDPLLDECKDVPEIAYIEPYIRPKWHNDIARVLLGVDQDPVSGNPTAKIPQTGKGQIIAVADTGLDDSHPDFQGRIVGLVALGRANDPSDPHGHGTHVSGSILGSGSASGGKLRGMAPEAQLFFQSVMDANGDMGGLPLDLGELFEEAYQAGARIHNNSWGSDTNSSYVSNSFEVDDFVAKRRDMLIVISAGNEGQAAQRLHSQTGFVDWLTIDSPASCKNALTVGASRSSRTSGGYAQETYGQAWPNHFPEDPIAADTISGNPEGMAAFSSRGPCDDHRIKPDLVAPGTDIASAKSSRAPLRNYWGAYPGNGSYAFLGGTSMAAPLVTGCAGLIRQYYVDERQHQASAALLKATLINSTRCLTGPDALADFNKLPNFHQGFGFLYMPWAIPNPAEPLLKLAFVDNWENPAKQLAASGKRARFQFSTTGGARLRICLAWTDPPARSLQNNLDLFLQHLQSGQKWIGNADVPLKLTVTDPENNVELIRLDNPAPGDYLIQVAAISLLQAPQDFALVVTGELTSDLMPV